jgi:hypothetical protein
MPTFVTPDAAALLAAEDRDTGRDEKLENYYPPDESEEVFCTTEEREDFEQYCEIALGEDVISDRSDYDALVRFLVETYALAQA